MSKGLGWGVLSLVSSLGFNLPVGVRAGGDLGMGKDLNVPKFSLGPVKCWILGESRDGRCLFPICFVVMILFWVVLYTVSRTFCDPLSLQ